MNANLLAGLGALLLLVLLVVVTTAAHAALWKVNRGLLRYLAGEGVPRARGLLSLVENAAALEASMAIANTAALVLSGVLATLLVVGYVGQVGAGSYAVGALSLLALLAVRLIAESVGAMHPDDTLHLLIGPVRVVHLLVQPLALPLRALASQMVPREAHAESEGASAAEEELRMIVDAVEDEVSFQQEEKEMIHGIFEMGETTAREIMVPRVDVVAVEASEPLRAVLDRIKARGHSRVPIYEETIDNVVGIVYAKDLLRHMEKGSLDDPARSLARPPYFIPESKKIDELLREMQRSKVHMAIVLDEYGGTAGLVTIEDMLEEIVGEIQDEYDIEEKRIEKLSDREAVFDARVSVHDVNETLDLSLANGEYDTVGGLVYDRLGKIPVVGDEVHVDGIALTVLSTVGKRIKKVKIRVEPEHPTGESGDE